jgi:hypothetical protein
MIPSIDHEISRKSVDSENPVDKRNLFHRIYKSEKTKTKRRIKCKHDLNISILP